MKVQALYIYLALISFILFQNAKCQSLPITSYGVWDRGGGVPDYNDPKADFVKGIETSLTWNEVQPIGPTSWNFSTFQ